MFGRLCQNVARRAFSTRTIIATPNAPAALGPYSQAVARGQDLYVAGCLGLCPKTGVLAGTTVEQAEQALANMKAILEAGGSSTEEVLKCVVYLTDINDFAAINAVYARYFPANPPVRTCFAVKELPKGATFEVDCVANIPKKN